MVWLSIEYKVIHGLARKHGLVNENHLKCLKIGKSFHWSHLQRK